MAFDTVHKQAQSSGMQIYFRTFMPGVCSVSPPRTDMVPCPNQYCWSSYSGGICTDDAAMIDLDVCCTFLGSNTADRQARYRLFVEQGVAYSEQKFLTEFSLEINCLATPALLTKLSGERA